MADKRVFILRNGVYFTYNCFGFLNNDKKQQGQMDRKGPPVRWDSCIHVLCAMALGEGVDLAFT